MYYFGSLSIGSVWTIISGINFAVSLMIFVRCHYSYIVLTFFLFFCFLIIWLTFSPLTSNSPTPILEQTWVSKTDVPTATTAYTTVPNAQNKDYTALTISHSAPASHQASFERGESVERSRPPLSNRWEKKSKDYLDITCEGAAANYFLYCEGFIEFVRRLVGVNVWIWASFKKNQ